MQPGAGQAEPEAPVSIEDPPPLTRLAAAMALFDVLWNRVVVRIVAGADQDLGISLQRFGVLPRNLAAVAGLIALITGLYTFLRMAGYAGLLRRLGVSSVAGLLTPAFVLALVLPKERVSLLVVVVALVASNLLIVLLGSVAVGYPGGARRWASGITMLSGAFVLTALVVGSVRSIAESPIAGPLGMLAHYGGELAWHSVPVLSLLALFRAQKGAPRSESAPLGRTALASAAVLVVAVVGAAIYGELRLHPHRFDVFVYGALRLTVLPESLSWLNGLTVGIAIAAAVVGLTSSSGGRVMVGAAAALWLSAGYAPRAPGQLLDYALAGLLLARAAQAVTLEGRERARLAWAPLVAPSPDA